MSLAHTAVGTNHSVTTTHVCHSSILRCHLNLPCEWMPTRTYCKLLFCREVWRSFGRDYPVHDGETSCHDIGFSLASYGNNYCSKFGMYGATQHSSILCLQQNLSCEWKPTRTPYKRLFRRDYRKRCQIQRKANV